MSLEGLQMPNTALIDAVRAFSEAAALTQLPAEQTVEIIEQLQALKAQLGEPAKKLPRQPFEAPALYAAAGQNRWGAGQFNTRVPQLALSLHGNSATATWQSTALDEGPPDAVHGGISAFLLDVVCGGLMQRLGNRAVTGYLNVKYKKKVPLFATVELRSELIEVRGRKHSVLGQILLDGEVLVESEGVFITI